MQRLATWPIYGPEPTALTLPVGADAAREPVVGQSSSGVAAASAREAYKIEVTPRRILVTATSSAGLFYGAVTLWQLLPAGAGGGDIHAQTIVDAPRYAWRGLMLDSARHFQSPAFVKSMIDWMAWHKLNVLHWHLTDDQGWRLEIRRYPRLTSVGSWRIPATVPGRCGTETVWRLLHSGRGAQHRRIRRDAPRANHSGNRHAGSRAGSGRRLSRNRLDRRPSVGDGLVEVGRESVLVQFGAQHVRVSAQRAR